MSIKYYFMWVSLFALLINNLKKGEVMRRVGLIIIASLMVWMTINAIIIVNQNDKYYNNGAIKVGQSDSLILIPSVTKIPLN